MSDTLYMNINEFVDDGYLHEVNRLVLHTLGLALEVTTDEETGESHLSGVWDYRDDPEGIFMDPIQEHKVECVRDLWRSRREERQRRLGYVVQPTKVRNALTVI